MDEAALIGTILADRYRLVETIGNGGMGRVYRAEDVKTGASVAVKLLHREFVGDEQVVQRFEREARLTTELAHPHIVNVIEFGEQEGRLFLVMELLAGKSLAELIGDGGKSGRRLTIKRTLAIMRSMFDALEYAHGRGVVHRDLKPENIMVIPGRGLLAHETIKLLDFGIAKLGHHPDRPAPSQSLTHNGVVIGTPAYMSPEQAAGQDADARSDIYSCGVILYQMLTGRRPFEAASPFDVLRMHLDTKPKALREVADGAWIPDGMENVILRALAKRPADRFQSARELRQALDQAAVIDYGDTGGGVAEPSAHRLSGGARFLCLAIIVGCAATICGDRLHARRAAAASAAAAAAAAAVPAPALVVTEPAPPDGGREPGERPRRSKHARAKRASARSH